MFKRNPAKKTLAAGVVLLVAGALAACAPASTSGGSATGSSDGTVNVVASTNVYGSIVEAIGKDHVKVTSIVNQISQDPHSYEATAQDRLKVADAKLVVVNGAGYDAFMDSMTKASNTPAENIINVVDLSGLQTESSAAPSADEHGHTHGEFNEHVWYSFPTMDKLATTIADKLSALAPASAAEFKANAQAFSDKVNGYTASLTKASAGKHIHVAMTEPVPGYMLDAAGFHNVTPEGFAEAIEEGHDVPATVLKDTLDLFSTGKASVLAYNEQTTGPQTDAVLAAAKKSNVTILSFTETLPDGKDYLGWMGDNVSQVEAALAKAN